MRTRFLLPCVAALVASGCGLVLGLDDFRDAPAATACTTPTDCPSASECVVATCNAGVCGASNVPEGTAITEQKSGDCKQVVCDGAGATKTVNDDGDVPVDGTECTTDLCTNGVPSNPPATTESKCSDHGGKVCDGAGQCVACVITADCASPEICKKNQCLDPACDDGVKDGTESDLDCGGNCAPCDNDKACGVDADCASGACVKNVCVSQCANGKQDGTETDVDCGGACPGCDDGHACGVDEDCSSHACIGGLCFAQECVDGIKNGTETDVDCGGGTCPACTGGKACTVGGDCSSGTCSGNVCVCVVDVAAGGGHTCARKGDDTLWCWGSNGEGQLGDGTNNDKPTPIQVAALNTDVIGITAGATSTCALKTDHTLWCWGGNQYGQLGDGTKIDKPSPVQVTSLGANVVKAAVGENHSCAQKDDATLWCWGDNSLGQLGDGTTTSTTSPVLLQGFAGAGGPLAVGLEHTCSGGGEGLAPFSCWGANTFGQIGDGTTVNKSSPVRVLQFNLGPAAAGYGHTCMAMFMLGVYCWGLNSQGEIGDGTTVDRDSPVKIAALGSDVGSVVAGNTHTCALKKDGTVWCWGEDTSGQLGNGCAGLNCTNETSPVQVVGLGANTVQIAAGGDHTCARKDDGTLWCWGDGTASPTQVPLTCP